MFRVWSGRWHVGAFDLFVGFGTLCTDGVGGFGFGLGVGVISLFRSLGVEAVN